MHDASVARVSSGACGGQIACAGSIPVDEVREAGVYVCNWSGQLLRVGRPLGGASAGGFNLVGSEPLFVTKLSDDPGLPLSRARRLAQERHLAASF